MSYLKKLMQHFGWNGNVKTFEEIFRDNFSEALNNNRINVVKNMLQDIEESKRVVFLLNFLWGSTIKISMMNALLELKDVDSNGNSFSHHMASHGLIPNNYKGDLVSIYNRDGYNAAYFAIYNDCLPNDFNLWNKVGGRKNKIKLVEYYFRVYNHFPVNFNNYRMLFHDGNSALYHFLARYGAFPKDFKDFRFKMNKNEDTIFHVLFRNDQIVNNDDNIRTIDRLNIWGAKNKDGETVAHAAVRAGFNIKKGRDWEGWRFKNNAGETVISLLVNSKKTDDSTSLSDEDTKYQLFFSGRFDALFNYFKEENIQNEELVDIILSLLLEMRDSNTKFNWSQATRLNTLLRQRRLSNILVAITKFDILDELRGDYRHFDRYKDNDGNTPLHWYVMKGHDPKMRNNLKNWLLANNQGNTVAHYAAYNGIIPEGGFIDAILKTKNNEGVSVDDILLSQGYKNEGSDEKSDVIEEEDVVEGGAVEEEESSKSSLYDGLVASLNEKGSALYSKIKNTIDNYVASNKEELLKEFDNDNSKLQNAVLDLLRDRAVNYRQVRGISNTEKIKNSFASAFAEGDMFALDGASNLLLHSVLAYEGGNDYESVINFVIEKYLDTNMFTNDLISNFNIVDRFLKGLLKEDTLKGLNDNIDNIKGALISVMSEALSESMTKDSADELREESGEEVAEPEGATEETGEASESSEPESSTTESKETNEETKTSSNDVINNELREIAENIVDNHKANKGVPIYYIRRQFNELLDSVGDDEAKKNRIKEVMSETINRLSANLNQYNYVNEHTSSIKEKLKDETKKIDVKEFVTFLVNFFVSTSTTNKFKNENKEFVDLFIANHKLDDSAKDKINGVIITSLPNDLIKVDKLVATVRNIDNIIDNLTNEINKFI